MPFQGLPWTEFISCPVCFKLFNERQQRPISLGCGHTVCKSCIRNRLSDNRCPFDQILLPNDVDKLPANFALMHLVGAAVPEQEKEATKTVSDNPKSYEQARKCIEEMAVHLKPLAENTSDDDSSTCSEPSPGPRSHSSAANSGSGGGNTTNNNCKCVLSRPMQRKLISLIHCQLLEEEGRSRAARIARSLGERIVSELLVLHQYPHQLSANLWAAVRTRGCQFLGPAMQEEVLKLILLALEDGSFLSRKVLVLFVVQRLESRYPQASKTAIGHVVQLLYRASCFKVLKREEESSLMQLKEEFRQYESLRREHDSQIVQIAIEAGLRISPEQWSSLLYGDPAHKSHMQSIIDKHQSPQSFAQSITELMVTLQRNGDHSGLLKLQPQLDFLSNIDPSPDCPAPSWENLEAVMRSLNTVMSAFVEFLSNPDHRSRLEASPIQNTRYKTSMCRDFSARGTCPRGNTCTFAHSQEELERYRSRSRRNGVRGIVGVPEKTSSSLSPSESDQLRQIQLLSKLKAEAVVKNGTVKVQGSGGKTPSVVELLDPKLAAGTPPNELGPLMSRLTLGQTQATTILAQQKLLQTIGAGTNQLDAEKPPFIPQAPSVMPATHLAFNRSRVDDSDNSNVATGPQPCFTPQSGNVYGPQIPVTPGTLMRAPSPFPPPIHLPGQSVPMGSQLRPPQLQNGGSVRAASPQCGPPSAGSGKEAGLVPVNMPGLTAQQAAEMASLCNGCVPCVAIQPVDGSDPHNGLQTPQLMTFPMQDGESLLDLQSRKQQIIDHLQQEDAVLMEPEGPVYLAVADRLKGFAGLKTVLSNNKRTKEALPQSVSDMFVATRSTQSLDDLLQDDGFGVKWSCGEDFLTDLEKQTTSVHSEAHRGQSESNKSSNNIALSIAATAGLDFTLFGNEEWKASYSNANSHSINSSLQASSGDAEFCSFPGDDGDESFIPFDQTSVSKFGPISRLSKVKTNNSAPVQVTADSCKRMTPVLAVTPIERPVATSMQMPSRFTCPGQPMEPSVKPTASENPSMWQARSFQPSYQNMAVLKAGAMGAVTNTERLAYQLQAIELEIALKTGKEPEPVRKILQDAVMASVQNGHYGMADCLAPKATNLMSVLGHGHVTDCLSTISGGEKLVSSQKAAETFMEDYYRSWQGIKM